MFCCSTWSAAVCRIDLLCPIQPTFETFLISKGVSKGAVNALVAEKVVSRHIFKSLKEEHIVRLLKCDGMSIGSHAILWELWEAESSSFCKRLSLCI